MTRRRIARAVLAVIFYPALLFGCAGTWRWPQGWVFLGLQALFSITLIRMLARDDPELLEERLKPVIQPDQPLWDRVIMVLLVPLMLAWLVIPALDVRFGWFRVPIPVQVLGGVLFVAGALGLHRTFRANTFLAPVVRVQHERGHKVIQSGPYAIVRHPMYAVMLLYMPGAALLMGSAVGALYCVVPGLLLVVRTALEDRLLQRELPGYVEYARKVRYRLVPGVW